ncbi:hypothetical protein ACWC4D_23580 [Streptomyces sp. NPDC001288]|uniref:hypothetical protein n=1 Tax=unclassified Streptomyces TaxID=2593676 RepID=UPI0033338BEC
MFSAYAMPLVAGITNLYTMSKDVNARLTMTSQQSRGFFTTIPESLLPYVDYENHREFEFRSSFYNHTRWKGLQDHFHTTPSYGTTLAYTIRFTVVSLDKAALQSANRKQLTESGATLPPSTSNLTVVRQEIRKIDAEIAALQTQIDDIKRHLPDKNLRDSDRGVRAELVRLRDQIMPLKMAKARHADEVNKAKIFIKAQENDEKIKELCRRRFISNFNFTFTDPMDIPKGVSAKGSVDIHTQKSLQPGAAISITLLWNEEHLLGGGFTWSGTLRFFLDQATNVQCDGDGKFYERFRECLQTS